MAGPTIANRSAVVSDLVDLAKSLLQPEDGSTAQMINPEKDGPFLAGRDRQPLLSALLYPDQPGILAKISGVFGKYGIPFLPWFSWKPTGIKIMFRLSY